VRTATVVAWASASSASAPWRDEPPAADDHDAIDELLHLGEHVARHQHRAALRGQLAQESAHPRDALRVEAVGRLVEHQHLRVPERTCQREPLAHPQRVTARRAAARRGQPDQVQDLVGARGGIAVDVAVDAQVIAAAACRMKARRLEHRSDLVVRRRQRRIAATADRGAARVRGDPAEQHPQRRPSCPRRWAPGSR
jgi:hypothetical protein